MSKRHMAVTLAWLFLFIAAPWGHAAEAVDTDTDGLPDDWEVAYFGDLGQTGTGDPDQDTLANADEYTHGTHPYDADFDGAGDLTDPYIDATASRYFILNSRLATTDIAVQSLVDNNVVAAGTLTLNLNRNEIGIIPADTLRPGDPVAAIGPIGIASERDGTDMPVPQSFAGTVFVIPHIRNTHTYLLLSPFGDTQATMDYGTGPQIIDLPMGQLISVDAGSDNTISAIITSLQPILVAHRSGYNDAFPVPPATTELLGIRSTNVVVGALEDNTTVTAYADNGATTTLSMQKGNRRVISIGSNTAEGQGGAIHVVADKPIGAAQWADTDGSEATAYLKPAYFGQHFGLPVNTQYVAVGGLIDNTSVTLYTAGNPVETKTLTSDGTTPGKIYFGSGTDGVNIAAGSWLESDQPIYVIYEAAGPNDEHNLLGTGPFARDMLVLDTDQDGILDSVEDINGNGSVDAGETDPRNPDTDSDGIPDGLEDIDHDAQIDSGETHPLSSDTDGDGIEDGIEDGNRNGIRDTGETDPRIADTDGDGLPDGTEDANLNGLQDAGETSPINPDSDNDGLTDGTEDTNHNGVVDPDETDPLNADSDADTMPDGWEVTNNLDPLGNDAAADYDGDGLSNLQEYGQGSLANRVDSDLDGIRDDQDPVNDAFASKYHVLNPDLAGTDISVVSLADGNTIIAGTTVLNLNQHETGVIPAGTLAPGAAITATAPIGIGSSRDSTDMPVPVAFEGKAFVIPHIRNTHTYFLLSPYGDATAQVDTGSGPGPVTLPQGQAITVNAGSTNGISSIITSDLPILVSHRGSDSTSKKDAYAVPPVGRDLIGFRTTLAYVGAMEDNTTLTVYADDGASSTRTLNRGGLINVNIGANSSQGSGSAIHIIADKPVAAVQHADSDGVETTAFFHRHYLGREYAVPTDAQYIAIGGFTPGTQISFYNGTAPVENHTLDGSATTPGKLHLGSTANGAHIAAGSRVISDQPIYMIFEEAVNSDEHNLLGLVAFDNDVFLVDVDTDGMADRWEYERFGNLDQNPGDDPDGDQITNLMEFQQGTDPGVAVTVSISASPSIIGEGSSSTLSWNSTNADAVAIDQGVGTVASSGSMIVAPPATTTYTITASGPGGTDSANTTVTVTPLAPPAADISAAPATIGLSEYSTLSWTTSDADTVSIDQGVGPVADIGTLDVNPVRTTTYTITATNANGTVTDSVTVTVTYPQPPGVYYEYDELGRIKKITRIPSP